MVAALEAAVAQVAAASEVADKYVLKGFAICQHALKGQKLLAQGIALGIIAVNKAPCKGKSFVYCLVLESFCPYRATNLRQ